MKYMGSKNRISKYIVPILEKSYYDNECEIFIDACCGGCNLIDKINPNIPRYANDYNEYLIEMWKGLQRGFIPKDYYTKEEYNNYKSLNQKHIKGYVGFNCSYSGKWFGGFAGIVETKQGIRNYQDEAKRNILKQIKLLKDVVFSNKSILDIKPNKKALIYCDIPYKNTTKYKDDFNHEKFYEWCREMKKQGHTIFISEYNMPDDFICVWSKEINSSLSANGKIGGNKKSIEKLFAL